jgi:chromosomal replication initiator protein
VTAVQDLWKRAGEILRSQVSEGVWQSTFAHVEPQERHDGELWLEVPNAIVRDKLDGRYRPLVEDAIGEIDTSITAVVVRVVESALLGPGAPPGENPTLFDDRGEPSHEARHLADHDPVPAAERTTRYTFDAFVIGQSNRFAHAAALSVAERPGGSYNPLFIYGGAGLGKTHLLRAIEAYVNEVYPQLKVQYVSTETFLNEFVDSIRTTTGNEFKRRYRQIDVLLVDDIQFIAGRDGLQEEFFHTFNDLYGANRQIVLSSDRQPDAIPTLEDRLRSRFMMGLITDIQPPDLETRMAILRKKADRDGYVLPNDVSEFIASNITNNIRELEGALNRVTAYSNLNRQTLTCELAEGVLADLIADRQPRPITPAVILESTAEMYGFTVEDLRSKSRRRPLVIARQVAMYVTRELTDLSYPAIAREFGGRDHTTVMHACDKISALMKERSQIYDQVTALDKAIRNRG